MWLQERKTQPWSGPPKGEVRACPHATPSVGLGTASGLELPAACRTFSANHLGIFWGQFSSQHLYTAPEEWSPKLSRCSMDKHFLQGKRGMNQSINLLDTPLYSLALQNCPAVCFLSPGPLESARPLSCDP